MKGYSKQIAATLLKQQMSQHLLLIWPST